MNTKSVMIAICGRPNVGKSTLTNTIVGEKVAIVSNKPQTTRNRICGIRDRGDTQLVFLDTPGFHRPRTKLGDYMVNVVEQSVANVDLALLLVEPIDNLGPQEESLIEQFRQRNVPAILVINKTDTLEDKDVLLPVIARYNQAFPFEATVPISAKTHEGVDELLDLCEKYAIESPWFFPKGMTSDQPERQVIAEIIREKMLWNLDKEIPHGTAVEITRFTERDSGIIDVEATIYCEKASHKGIIIGKGGQMLKKISSQARADCERFMGAKVYLQTWIKVKENWRDSDFLIRNFGYRNDEG